MIPYSTQYISPEDEAAVVEALRSEYLTQGPRVPAFEQAIAQYCDVSTVVAVNSATSALHIACLALGVGFGDIVWTSPITFVASANCAIYCGARVDFVDIDPETLNMSAAALEEKLEKACRIGKLPKVVIPVHMCGQSCEMDRIHVLSQKYGFKVIEDASHAIGGAYKGRPIGGCQFSDITVFSFHAVKIITSAEGGAATSNDCSLAEKMILLRSHGVTRNPSLMTHEPDGPWYYQQIDLGFNYRMTDILAALGLNQLKCIDQFVQRRRDVASRYDLALRKFPIKIPKVIQDARSAYHLYPIRIVANLANRTRRQVFDSLRQQNIGVNVHYIPIHTQPYYLNMGFAKADFPESVKYYEEAISLPVFYSMTQDQQDQVVSALNNALH